MCNIIIHAFLKAEDEIRGIQLEYFRGDEKNEKSSRARGPKKNFVPEERKMKKKKNFFSSETLSFQKFTTSTRPRKNSGQHDTPFFFPSRNHVFSYVYLSREHVLALW